MTFGGLFHLLNISHNEDVSHVWYGLWSRGQGNLRELPGKGVHKEHAVKLPVSPPHSRRVADIWNKQLDPTYVANYCLSQN